MRAGAHADTLLKTASSVHRDSALLLEHQCAACADLTMTMMEAKERIEAWRKEYNESRPHRALGERTPNEFINEIAASRNLIEMKTAENSP